MDSLEDIEKAFARRIKDAEDDDSKRLLELEKREAVADFRVKAADARELAAHKTSVLAEKGLQEWGDFINGGTAEEIDAAAAKIAERVESLKQVNDTAAAVAAYGRPGAGGGAPVGVKNEKVDKIRSVEERFNQSSAGKKAVTTGGPGGGSDSTVSVNELQGYVTDLLTARTAAHLAQNGSTPATRAGFSRIDPNTLGERV